jgi:predicted RNA binding protein YcfA (HicA-like mRNA interferase family)
MPKDDVAQPRKLIVFAFWELRRFLLAISGDWVVDFRAMALLALTQFSIIFSALEFGSIVLGRRLIPTGQLQRTRGSHHQFVHPTKPGTVTVPHPKKDLGKGLVRAIRKQAGLR